MVIDPTRPVVDIMDRNQEKGQLEELLAARRNVLMYGPRRTGKSSLLRWLAERLEKRFIVIHVDCTRHETEDETARLMLAGLGRAGAGRWRRFWDWMKDHLAATETRIVTDADGARIEFDPSSRAAKSIPDALELIGRVADAKGVPALVILDEFQVVMARKDAPIAAMRSVAQEHRGLVLVLSGSVATILRRLVDEKAAPFWNQLVELPIRGLSIDDVRADLGPHGIKIDDDDRALLRIACGTSTLRLMEVLQILERERQETVASAVERVAFLHAPEFEREMGRAKPGIQRRCLIGLARDLPEHALGADFIRDHELGSPGNVQRALRRLRDLEIIDDEQRFLDPMFAHWLRSAQTA